MDSEVVVAERRDCLLETICVASYHQVHWSFPFVDFAYGLDSNESIYPEALKKVIYSRLPVENLKKKKKKRRKKEKYQKK